jgi:GMP synthase (glutamine-hydrolysing)
MTANPEKTAPRGPVLILQHEAVSPSGTVGAVLQAEGIPFVVRHLYAGEPAPSSDELPSLSAVIPLGGGMNTDEDERYPWLAGERRVLRDAVELDVPVLGICLGAQQLAAATGGRVYHRERPERGWMSIDVTGDDELFDGLPRSFSTLQWHVDSFEAPPEAALFAERGGGQQAFRLGRRAWGVQFHPEVDDDLLDHWLDDADREDPAFGVHLRELRREIVAGSVAVCATIVRNFARCL